MSNETGRVTRKLRAILSADVKGYSLLMADDEVFTIRTLKEYREIMFDLIQQHSGRVVDNPGDNLLAEFSSAVDAVETAVAIQKKLKLPQNSASHHLGLLRESGLVVNRREGKQKFYSLADLSKHRLGKKSELTKRGSNAAKFGPVELVLPKK